jgi:cell division protein FtsB
MQDFKRKKMVKNILFSYATIFVLGIFIALMSMSVFERFTVEREMSMRRVEAEKELKELKLRAAALESQVEYLEDDRGMEAEIRGRFDVVKDGEQVVIILDDEEVEKIEPVTGPVVEDEPWYKFW